MTKAAAAGVIMAAAMLAAPAGAQDCAQRDAREATLDAAGATRVEIVARAGTLDIAGLPGAKRLKASGTACASDAKRLAEVRLKATRSGATLRVEVQIPEDGAWAALSGSSKLDLSVEVPAELPLDVRDSSGALTIRHVGALTLEDSSGEATIEGVTGALSVLDSSGELRISKVRGDVRVTDSSGEVVVRGVDGDVEITADSSGGIEIEHVTGSVRVRADSSGGIDVRDVGGDFTVDSDSGGGIRHRDVKGRVSLPDGK